MTLPREIHLPALGQLPTDVDPTLLKFLQAVKDILSVGGGINTDHLLEKNVTRRDLEALGFSSDVIDNPDVTYTFGGGDGGGASGVAPDPPTSFQITQRAFSNKLTWVNPANTDFAATWVYFGINGVDYDLIAVITAPTSFYNHSLLEAYGDHQYYKIEAVNTAQQQSSAVYADITLTTKDTINELTDLLFGTSDYYTRNYTVIADSFTVSQPSQHVLVWTDKNFLEGDIVTYGTPPGGGGVDPSNAYFALVDITAPAAAPDVNADWKNLTNDEFTNLASTRPMFKIGYIDSQPTVGIRGDLVVDGGIAARTLSATDVFTNHLQSRNWSPGVSGYKIDADAGHIFTYDMDVDITNGTITSRAPTSTVWEDKDYLEGSVVTYGEFVPGLDTDPSHAYYANTAIATPADPPDINAGWTNLTIAEWQGLGATSDHVEMTSGELTYKKWNGTEFVVSKALKHIESDEGIPSGSVVTLPGYWFSIPIIRVFTDRVGIFDYSHAGDQAIECYAGNPTLINGEVTFTGVVQLIASQNSVDQYPASGKTNYLWVDHYDPAYPWPLDPPKVFYDSPDPLAPCFGTAYADYPSYTLPEVDTTVPADRVSVTINVSGGVAGRIIINDARLSQDYGWVSAGAINIYMDVMISGIWYNSVRSLLTVSSIGNYVLDYTNVNGIQKVRARVYAVQARIIHFFIPTIPLCYAYTPYPLTVAITKVVNHVNSSTVLDSGTFSYIAIEKD